MLEFLVCSMVTIFPDYLFRRYAQGKRIGQEIDLFTMWYELRWGITACLILTVTLITIVFFYHPSTTNVTSAFRTVSILSEGVGRVDQIFVQNGETVTTGQLLFTLDDSQEQAAVSTAQERVKEIDAQLLVAQSDLESAIGRVDQARGAFEQTNIELQRKLELQERNAGAVTEQSIDSLRSATASRAGALEAALAEQRGVEARISNELPAARNTSLDQIAEAQAALAKKSIYAETDGVLEQFTLQRGDIVNPVLRPAGILIPTDTLHRFQAGFGQIAAPVLKVGMTAEITCTSLPFTIIPMVIVEIQDVISSGQLRPTDRLLDATDLTGPGTFVVGMEPLYKGQTDPIPRGSRCIANAYTDNHELLESGELGLGQAMFYHMVDTLGIMHAFILRLQALTYPVQTLVISGH